MSGAQRDGDQSMDDILASIRKIISDDGAPGLAADGASGDTEGTRAGPDTIYSVDGVGAADDLSDILEEPKASSESQGIAAPAANGIAQLGADVAWPAADDEAKASAVSSSLTDKLASLGSSPGNGNTAKAVDVGAGQRPVSEHSAATIPASVDTDPGTLHPGTKRETLSLEETLASVREAAGAADAERGNAAPTPGPVLPAEATEVSNQPVPAGDASVSVEPGARADSVGVVASAVEAVAPATARAVAASVTGDRGDQAISVGEAGGKSVEVLVMEALKPMLQQWLDANLPRMVEEKLQEELKRRVK